MSKVSVIIAAYNVEKYITETMNSVVAQTLKDIEIIVVDDCSTDSTLEIVSKYAELDSRIKIVKQPVNNGLVRSRQTGLKNSTGEYVIFLDGDDSLSSDACEKAYNAITKEKVDILRFNIKLSFDPPMLPDENVERDIRKAMSSLENKAVSVSKAGLLDAKAIGGIINFSIWDKIYKRSLLTKASEYVPDEYLNMAEDVLYSFLIHYHARSYSYIDDQLYIYRFGCGMSTTPKVNQRIIEAIAKNAYVYNYLVKWVDGVGAQKECEAAIQRLHEKLFAHIVSTYIYRLKNDTQREEFASAVINYCGEEAFLLALSDHIYSKKFTPDRIASDCAGLKMFATTKKQAKTIGVYYFRMYNGGIENVISSITDIWVKSGYDVVLFTDEPPHKDDYYLNPAIKRVIVPKMKKRDFAEQKNRIESFRKSIIDSGIDIMVYNAWASADLTLDEMIIKSCGVNLVIHMHSMFCSEISCADGMTSYYFSTLPKLYSFVDSVVAIADVDAAWWQTMGLRCFKTINPIQLSMDAEQSPLNGNNLLYVGRISEEKRTLDAIRIAELVRERIPDVKLTVVGKGDDKDYIKEVETYVFERGLGGLVDMVGFKSNVLPYYQSADIMLTTSRFEGCPLAPLEAKVCGVPMVMYEIPSLDIIRNNKGMVIVDQMDVAAAADAVVEILSNNELKRKLGREARESVEEFYGMDLAEHWKNIFEQTVIPKPERLPIYKLSASEAAVRIAVENYSNGIYKRALITEMQASATAMNARCIELEKELEKFKRSESYRVGMLITYIPRKIKNFLKRLLRRR